MAKSKEYWQDLSKLPTIPEELETFDDTRSRSVAFNEEVVMPTAKKFGQETKQNQETFRHWSVRFNLIYQVAHDIL